MYFSISDEVVSQFMSGLVVVLALVVVGCTIALILNGMARRFPFSRLALVFALAPVSFLRFMESADHSSLQLYSTIVILLGITIDGINYLLEPKARPAEKQEKAHREETRAESRVEEPPPGVIVWEKAK